MWCFASYVVSCPSAGRAGGQCGETLPVTKVREQIMAIDILLLSVNYTWQHKYKLDQMVLNIKALEIWNKCVSLLVFPSAPVVVHLIQARPGDNCLVDIRHLIWGREWDTKLTWSPGCWWRPSAAARPPSPPWPPPGRTASQSGQWRHYILLILGIIQGTILIKLLKMLLSWSRWQFRF